MVTVYEMFVFLVQKAHHPALLNIQRVIYYLNVFDSATYHEVYRDFFFDS